eukprot:CAMPEP_0172440334 /NCGR_PEP_ID=MMETSP1065-20121228/982_1 /TAXON_ID=265537 /ORGANISM="Amphiprora paludosa, Strain CCMP125" /LENGTH=320 /DNA_ID=CAMNT_0013189123 /DNA_START=455 /DNA_END=1417 /DNA_ORIENTATION=-
MMASSTTNKPIRNKHHVSVGLKKRLRFLGTMVLSCLCLLLLPQVVESSGTRGHSSSSDHTSLSMLDHVDETAMDRGPMTADNHHPAILERLVLIGAPGDEKKNFKQRRFPSFDNEELQHSLLKQNENKNVARGPALKADEQRVATTVDGGGDKNQASSFGATVAGGYQNIANGSQSAVSGGQGNTASGAGASVSGGHNNIATGQMSVVVGGQNGLAIHDNSAVLPFGSSEADVGCSTVTICATNGLIVNEMNMTSRIISLRDQVLSLKSKNQAQDIRYNGLEIKYNELATSYIELAATVAKLQAFASLSSSHVVHNDDSL